MEEEAGVIEFEVDGNLGYQMADVDQWTEAAEEYINLLQDSLAKSAVYLFVHGWVEDDAIVERGKELRAILGIKGSGA